MDSNTKELTKTSNLSQSSITTSNSDGSSVRLSPEGQNQNPKSKPDARLRVRTMCLLGALLPGIGCYICIAYTYLFQLDKVMNFTSTNCHDVKSTFPPVSYSIGVWRPQKYFWLIVLALHLPPRLFYGMVYKNQFHLADSGAKENSWYPFLVQVHIRLIWVEVAGLVTVSVIDIESNFAIHAFCYAVWITSFCVNMFFNSILYHHSGISELMSHDKLIFRVKCTIFVAGSCLAISTGISYFSYMIFCSGLAYALFSVAEYILVGLNSLFYFLLVWELSDSQVEFYMAHEEHINTRVAEINKC
uniref:CWH43-like N-terminal domain-containing protein n=1 Tax=Ditylenchus dipsaci TaxID=166011 RepID=A0A915DVT9_9BILA